MIKLWYLKFILASIVICSERTNYGDWIQRSACSQKFVFMSMIEHRLRKVR